MEESVPIAILKAELGEARLIMYQCKQPYTILAYDDSYILTEGEHAFKKGSKKSLATISPEIITTKVPSL